MFREEKCLKSQKFAAENGLPIMKNVMLPKTRGFHTCLEILRGSLDAGWTFLIIFIEHMHHIFLVYVPNYELLEIGQKNDPYLL